jgi:hypothetical protein
MEPSGRNRRFESVRGLAKIPLTAFPFRSICVNGSVRWVWSLATPLAASRPRPHQRTVAPGQSDEPRWLVSAVFGLSDLGGCDCAVGGREADLCGGLDAWCMYVDAGVDHFGTEMSL